MVIDLDYDPGKIFIKDPHSVLGLTLDVLVTPDQARALAENLETEGKHTVAAEGLRRAADDAEKRKAHLP